MSADTTLRDAATALCRDVSGIDWNGEAVQADIQQMLDALDRASSEARSAAFNLLLDRLHTAKLEDADGVAHVAITAGTLVEHGEPAALLAEVLLAKLPDVLQAARRFADACLADLGEVNDDEDEPEGIAYVDGRAIPRDVFRAHLAADRPGACALHRLDQWVLPAIAACTRDRGMVRRACEDDALRAAAATLRRSAAHWLHMLLGVQLDARWLVVSPVEERGFHIVVDGVTSNFELHTLVGAALIDRGLRGERPPESLVEFIGGKCEKPGVGHAEGVWNYYSWTAAAFDLAANDVPLDHWVWNEGAPRDVPELDGMRTLLVGPASIQRTWNVGRTFGGLGASVRVDTELSHEEVRSKLDAIKRRLRSSMASENADGAAVRVAAVRATHRARSPRAVQSATRCACRWSKVLHATAHSVAFHTDLRHRVALI